MRGFFSDKRGIAAIEFALALPLLVALSFSIYELTYRLQIADELERYTFQLGDYLARSAELTNHDIDEIYTIADKIMPVVNFNESSLSILVQSIGFEEDGDPILLWSRSRGEDQLTYDLESARGLAPPGQSVLVSRTRLETTSMLSLFDTGAIIVEGASTFKPRTTRAVAFDGNLTDSVEAVVGYDDA